MKDLHVSLKRCLIAILGGVILATGLYNIHAISGVTEGGILGLTLLLDHWFGISPSVTSIVGNVLCYLLGIKLFGKDFVLYSTISAGAFSICYKIWEQFPQVYPEIANHPLIAALVGALFVGLGAGLCVRVGGAPSGDDAFAMSLSHMTQTSIQWWYLISDLSVLGLSLTYIPLRRIGYSLVTVVLSGQLVGLVQKTPNPWNRKTGNQ